MEPEILYEDGFLIAFNKPAGLMVHHDTHTKKGTLSDWLLKERPELKGIGETMEDQKGETIERPGIVHRLDKDTSGVILVAKTQEAHAYLKNAFQHREVTKTYRAVVYGAPKEDTGIIDKPITRSTTDFRKRAVREKMEDGAREALTEYKVLKKGDEYSYIEVYPRTGRTHQIRVHLNALGNPVVCDPVYASRRACPKTLGRLALHAYKIELMLPNNTRLVVEAKEPEEFGSFLAEQDLV